MHVRPQSKRQRGETRNRLCSVPFPSFLLGLIKRAFYLLVHFAVLQKEARRDHTLPAFKGKLRRDFQASLMLDSSLSF